MAANGRKGGRPEKQLLSPENQLLSSNPPAAPSHPPAKQMLSAAKQKLSRSKQLPAPAQAIEKASNFSFTTSTEVGGEAAEAAPPAPPAKKKKSVPPALADVQAYAAAQHPGNAEAAAEVARFFDHYTSNGWRVGGKTPMVDWPAAFRNWLRRAPQFTATAGQPSATTPARAKSAPRAADPTRWS